MKARKAVAALLVLLGLLVCGASWSMATSSWWPLVLFFGLDLVLAGGAMVFAVVVEGAERDRDERYKMIQRLQQAGIDE